MPDKKDLTLIDTQTQLTDLFGGNIPDRASAQETFGKFRLLMTYYRCAMKEIVTKFEVLNEEFSLQYDRNPISSIQSRLKSGISIHDKLKRRNIPITVDNIENELSDIAGIRLICPFLEDVYYLEKALLAQDDIQLIERKNYIDSPKQNGYRSLHLIVAVPIFLSREKRIMKVEVQIRTIAMDSWASLEHQLRYKKDFEFTQAMEDELKHCADLSNELDIRMDALRRQLLNQEETQ